ncbi:hypothetical protein [Denitromonas sp.]|uniref:hypothetical protein n=1 Tax=Denitromonas sp. TaxID=2734609 RepID=UPI002AFF3E2B|nr:hypothetical protein [Denitromonas sp.]
MNRLLTVLPGSRREPPGAERKVLRLLPRVLWLGSALVALPSLLVRLFGGALDVAAVSRVDIYVASVMVLHWTVVLTVAIAAAIVWVMKGPAYVADAYPVSDAERPVQPGGRGA